MAATPPTFNPAPAKSGNKIWLWIILALVAFCVILAAGIFFVGKSLLGKGLEVAACAMNGDLATNAVLAYALEHEGQLPDSETWQDDIRPYYETLYDKMIDDMDMEDVPGWINFEIAKPGEVLTCNNADDFKTGFAFNSQLAGTNTADYDSPDDVILLWEMVNPVYNGSGDPSDRPATDPNLKMFGDARSWWDFYLSGDSDSFQSDQQEFNFDFSPEDAIDPPSGSTGAVPEDDGSGESN